MSEELQHLEIFYHYTAIDGLEGIIGNKNIRASHIGFLNDQEEYKYFLDLLKSEFVKSFSEEQAKSFIEYFCKTRLQFNSNFVICFSPSANDLTLWRGYGKQGGYSIGFCRKSLETAFSYSAKEHDFRECIYDKTEAVTAINSLMCSIKGMLAFDPINELGMSYFLLQSMTENIASFFKSKSFIDEKEWRLCLSVFEEKDNNSIKNLKFRKKNNYLVPYIEIEIDPATDIKEIWVGPMDKQELAEKGLAIFLEKNGLDPKIIKCSEIPYREF